MDILQVPPRYPPSNGGIQRHVKKHSEQLVAKGHTVTVLTSHEPKSAPLSEKRSGVSILRVPAYTPYQISPAITSTVRSSAFDVIHIHGYHSLSSLCAFVGGSDANLVFTPHYLGTNGPISRRLLLTAYRPFGQYMFRRADTVIAVSEWEKEQLQQQFGISTEIIPNGIDLERFSEPNIHLQEKVPNQPYVFSLGRLVEYKGHQHIVRALPYIDFNLVIAGDGPYRKALEELAREHGVADRVHFLGYVDDDLIPGLYAGAKAHITLSEYECFGLTVGESLAAGTPCVVRESTALKEWAGTPGCIGLRDISPENVADAINRTTQLIPQSEQLFTWEEMSERISTVYEGLLE
ncbi:glycosyltransferase family 4 protein [Natronoglomus mannanivorans]|uniref:Glycosyltransferase family 4 protein n=1 Tax=Natronoglomus mannanivorans TaxID=2979990 RepID=A0AAP3DZU7_9EURY|nr:glycosyltransferase family 4 protein [Halobacteria archaeon AArc-xg1-1]